MTMIMGIELRQGVGRPHDTHFIYLCVLYYIPSTVIHPPVSWFKNADIQYKWSYCEYVTGMDHKKK